MTDFLKIAKQTYRDTALLHHKEFTLEHAQVEALLAIAEEFHTLNCHLESIRKHGLTTIEAI